jgi:LysR family nitrogen assimilation transcriptional regulator
MDLKQLGYFVHVAELGSFTKAAALLEVAQPALSRQVRSLEVELGQNLLYRNGRGVSTTEAGKRLLAHGRGILQQVERARDELDDVKGAPVGHLVVGAPPSVARLLSVPLVREFRRRHPKATLGIVEGLSTYMHEWLLMGRIDIGLLYNPVPSPAVDLQPFIEEDLYLIRPRSDLGAARKTALQQGAAVVRQPLALRELPGFPLLIPSRPHAIRMFVETQLAHAGLRPQVAMEIDGVPAILDLVAEGYGYAVLPLNAIRGAGVGSGTGSGMDSGAGSVAVARPALYAQPIARPRLRSRLALALPAQRPLTPLARATRALIEEVGARVLKG